MSRKTTGMDRVQAKLVLEYWAERSKTHVRSEAVLAEYLARVITRIKEGYSVMELQRCVDFACYDEFYLDHAYHKQPHVIFRNAARVDRLLRSAEQVQKRPIPL